MKRKYILLTILSFIIGICSVSAVELELYSENVVLYNLDNNTILYEKNMEEEISIASLTKIMTAIVAIENIPSLDETVVLTMDDFRGLKEANASVAGFSVGQTVTYRDLLYGLLLPSGADAALALARNIAGSKEAFIELMNQKAASLGLLHTHFSNETGLDEEGNYSTVKEVAVIFQYALTYPDLKVIFETPSYTMHDGSFSVLSTIQKNIQRYHLPLDYIIGGKTGTTYDAGLCLASFAYVNGTNYMLVTAKAPYGKGIPYNFYDAKTIYEYFMVNYGIQTLVSKGDLVLTLKTKYAKEKQVDFYIEENLQAYLPNTYDRNSITYKYKGIETVSATMKENTHLGSLQIYYGDTLLKNMDIILKEPLHFDIFKYISSHSLQLIFGCIGILSVIFGFIICMKQRSHM